MDQATQFYVHSPTPSLHPAYCCYRMRPVIIDEIHPRATQHIHNVATRDCEYIVQVPLVTSTWFSSINTLRPKQITAIFRTTSLKASSWMKIHEFRLRFHKSLFLRVQLTIFQFWSRQRLGAGQTTGHCLNQWWLVYWRIYASLGLNELNIWHLTHLRI